MQCVCADIFCEPRPLEPLWVPEDDCAAAANAPPATNAVVKIRNLTDFIEALLVMPPNARQSGGGGFVPRPLAHLCEGFSGLRLLACAQNRWAVHRSLVCPANPAIRRVVASSPRRSHTVGSDRVRLPQRV